MKDDDWNPFFTRKKKRNRVSRGAPARARRYFFWPCALLVGLTLLFRMGVVGQLFTWLSAIEIHVSYNVLDEHSKWRSPDGRFLLSGIRFTGTFYECEVSQEFWIKVRENTHVSVPSKQCRVIDPTVTISGSLPLSNGGYDTISPAPSGCAVLGGQARVGGGVSGLCLTGAGGGDVTSNTLQEQAAPTARLYCTAKGESPRPSPRIKLGRKVEGLATWSCWHIVTNKTP